jgi:hypothetical protein
MIAIRATGRCRWTCSTPRAIAAGLSPLSSGNVGTVTARSQSGAGSNAVTARSSRGTVWAAVTRARQAGRPRITASSSGGTPTSSRKNVSIAPTQPRCCSSAV